MNKYYETICEVKKKIKQYLDTIFQVSGDELLLELEHYNLLSNKNNCIETSTAIGFLLEEYVTSKLSIYTSKFKNEPNEVVITKLANDNSTLNSSYDCYAKYKNILFLINIKVQKNTSHNYAVAAINILYNDYVVEDPDQEKAYLILKTHYSFNDSPTDGERKIAINKTECYALEEVDFSEGHMQDHRNWSEEFNPNSGRLQISPKWLETYKLDENKISYSRTKKYLKDIYDSNT
ncbi:MAG: hypothetical protein Q4F88_03015 [Eubacteriales bacterium]|nr:hypothetical protein [Eubacteriales bacterium]